MTDSLITLAAHPWLFGGAVCVGLIVGWVLGAERNGTNHVPYDPSGGKDA